MSTFFADLIKSFTKENTVFRCFSTQIEIWEGRKMGDLD